jgi:organic hydroperoxide reductase OsmC/OhrA
MSHETFTIELHQQADYRFEVGFQSAHAAALTTDAAPPLGAASGPNSEELLLAAVGNCLSASLLFSLRKFKNEPGPMHTRAQATLVRNPQGRLRVGGIEVEIKLGVPAAGLKMLDRSLAQFEDFCVVTQSVRAGIPVEVRVVDSEGQLLQPAGDTTPPAPT